MINSYVFKKEANLIKHSIHKFDLKKILENDRTTIYQNAEMRFSIDQSVIRVLIFDETNQLLLETLRNDFYGKAYEKL